MGGWIWMFELRSKTLCVCEEQVCIENVMGDLLNGKKSVIFNNLGVYTIYAIQYKLLLVHRQCLMVMWQ